MQETQSVLGGKMLGMWNYIKFKKSLRKDLDLRKKTQCVKPIHIITEFTYLSKINNLKCKFLLQ